MLDPASASTAINLLRRLGITTGSPTITVGVIDTGYRPHADLAGRFIAGLRLHRRRPRRERRQRPRLRRLRPGRLDHERRERERILPGLRRRQQLVARHARVRHDRSRREQRRLGVVGISQVSKIQPLRVLGKCGGYTSDIADAIRWAAGLRSPACRRTRRRIASSTSASAAAARASRRSQSAINAAVSAGTVVVVAAGNSNARRGELLTRELQQRRSRSPRPGTPASGRTTRTTARRSRSRRRAATPSSARRSSRRSTPARRPGRRLVCELPGHEHGDAARGRRRLADAVREPDADAGPGDDDAAVDGDEVPGRQHLHHVDVRLGHRQRGGSSRRCEGRRRGPPRRVTSARPRPRTLPRSPARRQPCSGARARTRRATRTASTPSTTGRAMRLDRDRRCNHRVDLGTARGQGVLLAGAGDERDGHNECERELLVDVLHSSATSECILEVLAVEQRHRPAHRSRSSGRRAPALPPTSGASRP